MTEILSRGSGVHLRKIKSCVLCLMENGCGKRNLEVDMSITMLTESLDRRAGGLG